MKLKNENKWKTATTILSIVCVIMLAIVIEGHERNKEFNYYEEKTPEELCLEIEGTPAWIINENEEYRIFSYGYKGNEPPDGTNLVDFLIESKIYMLYSSNCGWCKKQIEDLGEDWIKYKNAGLTIDCSKI